MTHDYTNDNAYHNAVLVPKLEKKFAEINDLLYTTSVPNDELEKKVMPYIADDVIFKDPWQEGGNKNFYNIGMKGFHNMMHFTFDTYQIGVKLNGPDGTTGRCIVDGVMNLKQFSWIYTFPLRTIVVYDFRMLDANGPEGPKFEIFRQEEMWSYLELIDGIPGIGWVYGKLFRPAFGHLFVDMVMEDQSFFDDKLSLVLDDSLKPQKIPETDRDVIVNFCTPNILSGASHFQQIHDEAGAALKAEIENYAGMGPGSCRLTPAFDLAGYQKIAHCVLPTMHQSTKFVAVDEYDVSLCYRNALDMAAEAGLKSIVFDHPYILTDDAIAKVALDTIKKWITESPYASKFTRIIIACHSSELLQLYVSVALPMGDAELPVHPEDDSAELFDPTQAAVAAVDGDTSVAPQGQNGHMQTAQQALIDYKGPVDMKTLEALLRYDYEDQAEQQMGGQYDPYYDGDRAMRDEEMEYYNQSDLAYGQTDEERYPSATQYLWDKYQLTDQDIHQSADQIYDEMFKTTEGLQLQLSRNLSSTILTIEEENGMLRQYRMTTQSREGDTSYFRCSRCESLMKHTQSEYRPKITVKNGYIYGDCYPVHHPDCRPLTKYSVILQQMDREARMSVSKPEVGYNPYDIEGADYSSDSAYPELQSEWRQNGSRPMAGSSTKRAAPTSARARLRMVGPNGSPYYETTGGGRNSATLREVVRSVGGDTLQAIRKCEDELDGEGYGGDTSIPESDAAMMREQEYVRPTGSILHHRQPSHSYSKHDPTSNTIQYEDRRPMERLVYEMPPQEANIIETTIEGPIEGVEYIGGNGTISGDPNSLPMLDASTSAEMVGHGGEPPELGYGQSVKRRRLISRPPVAYRIPYPEDSEGYADNPEDESPAAPAAALGEKCRKYRIIRARRRTNVAFDWSDGVPKEEEPDAELESDLLAEQSAADNLSASQKSGLRPRRGILQRK
ncbi:macro domain-containing protein [Ditylenchus destructor]|nr:macro domain-containing protein [Ditylenchus destructor]